MLRIHSPSHYHEPDRPVWNFEEREDLRDDLHEQPGNHRVRDRPLYKTLRRFSSAKNFFRFIAHP
jgi:hypothetical protein